MFEWTFTFPLFADTLVFPVSFISLGKVLEGKKNPTAAIHFCWAGPIYCSTSDSLTFRRAFNCFWAYGKLSCFYCFLKSGSNWQTLFFWPVCGVMIQYTISCSSPWQEEVARLVALQPQVDLLEKRLNELKGEKRCKEDPSAFLDADINAFKEHYSKVLEDLRARERQLQLGKRMQRWRWRITKKLLRFFVLIHALFDITKSSFTDWIAIIILYNPELFIKSTMNATASSSLVLQTLPTVHNKTNRKHFTHLLSESQLNDLI